MNDDDGYSASGSNQSIRKSPADLSPQITTKSSCNNKQNQSTNLSLLNPNKLGFGPTQNHARLASHLHGNLHQQQQQIFAICSNSSPNSNSHANSIYSASLYGMNANNNKQNNSSENQQEIILTNDIIDNNDNSSAYLNWLSQDQSEQVELNHGRTAMVGSLDRRSSILFHQEQPIYLRTLMNDDIEQQNQNLLLMNGFGSIDRCNISHQLRNNSNNINNHTQQQQQQQLHSGKRISRQRANSNQKSIVHGSQNNNNNNQHQSFQAKSNQRVAFDLSPYELKQNNNQQQQQQHILPLINKATSDSSGSNSNQTGDSGHESPLTNANSSATTTTTTTVNAIANGCNHANDHSTMSNNVLCDDGSGQMQFAFADSLDFASTNNQNGFVSQETLAIFANNNQLQQQQNHQHYQIAGCNEVIAIGTASSLGSSITCSPAISDQLISPNPQTSGLLMLVQEDHQQQANNLSLHKNHQMATSFHANAIANNNNNSSSSSISVSKQSSNYHMIGLPTINTNLNDNTEPIYLVRDQFNKTQQQQTRDRGNQRLRHQSNNNNASDANSSNNLNDSSEIQDVENWL